jgi:hypothetical protein
MIRLFGQTFDPLALYAAVIGTLSLILSIILAIRVLFTDIRRVRVNCWIATEEHMGGPIIEIEWVVVEAVNIGHRPVTIVAMGFVKGKEDFIVETEAESAFGSFEPTTLTDGQTVRSGFWIDEIEMSMRILKPNELHEIQAYARDAGGNEYHSDLPNEWIERILSARVEKAT